MCDINFLLTHYEEDTQYTQYIFSVLNAKESMKKKIRKKNSEKLELRVKYVLQAIQTKTEERLKKRRVKKSKRITKKVGLSEGK